MRAHLRLKIILRVIKSENFATLHNQPSSMCKHGNIAHIKNCPDTLLVAPMSLQKKKSIKILCKTN